MKMEVLTVQNQFQSHQFGVMKHPKVEGNFKSTSRPFQTLQFYKILRFKIQKKKKNG